MSASDCVVLGGGGHARVLIECLRAAGAARPVAILDANAALWGSEILAVPVRGGDELLPALRSEGVQSFVVGLGAVGDNAPRQRLFETGLANGLEPVVAVHPSAVCSPSASIGPGTVIFPGAIVNAGAQIGENVIVNTRAVVEHDCVVGNHVHVATGSCLASTVRVGRGAHIGAAAVVLQCVEIGDGAIVGAGAVVVRTVPAGLVVVGVPARALEAVVRRAAP